MFQTDKFEPEFRVERLRDGVWRHVAAFMDRAAAADEFARLRIRYPTAGLRMIVVRPICVVHSET